MNDIELFLLELHSTAISRDKEFLQQLNQRISQNSQRRQSPFWKQLVRYYQESIEWQKNSRNELIIQLAQETLRQNSRRRLSRRSV